MDDVNFPVLLISLLAVTPGYIISIVLLTGRGADLIAGYNTLSTKEKQKWNAVAMCRFVGILLLVNLLLLSAGIVVLIVWESMTAFWVLLVLSMIWLGLGLLYLNKSKRFKN